MALVGFVTVRLNFLKMIYSKNAKYCNALLFLTAKYSHTCANSVDTDQTASDEDMY